MHNAGEESRWPGFHSPGGGKKYLFDKGRESRGMAMATLFGKSYSVMAILSTMLTSKK